MIHTIAIFIARKIAELLAAWLVLVQSFYLTGLVTDYKLGNFCVRPLINFFDYWAYGFMLIYGFMFGIMLLIGLIYLVKWNWEEAEYEANKRR